MVFTQWMNITVRTQREACETELARVQKEAGEKKKSIWNMRQVELVEVARAELGYTVAQADALLVPILKERIRAHRAIQKIPSDPLAIAPHGFGRLYKHQLVEEMAKRNIPMPTTNMTRPAMMELIQQDIEHRAEVEKQRFAEWTEPMEVTMNGTGFAMDDEVSISTPRRPVRSRSSRG